MKTLQSINRSSTLWAVGATLLALAAVAAFSIANRGNGELQIIHLDADYKTYSTSAELKAAANTIFSGTILDNGTTRDSAATPGVPRTEFSVRVDRVHKGDVKNGDTVVVVLTGGTVGNRKYVFEDMDLPARDSSMLMYLEKGSDGKYYPLAGGTALASKKEGSNTFVLPQAVSGSAKSKNRGV